MNAAAISLDKLAKALGDKKKLLKMAEGGKVEDLDPNSPAKALEEDSGPEDADLTGAPEDVGKDIPQTMDQARAGTSPQTSAPEDEYKGEPGKDEPLGADTNAETPDLFGEPQSPEQALGEPPQREPPPPTEADMAQDQSAYLQDLQSGAITPKTYHDLYASKDTIGKVGTLFGLLIAGAGSGLTGQPNMLMEMMNREIDRDLQAQMKSKETAVNFYNAATQRMKTQADVRLLSAQTAKAEMQLSAMKEIYGIVDNMPPGPGQTQAKNVADQMGAQVSQQIANDNAKTSMFANANYYVRHAGESPAPNELPAGQNIDLKKLTALNFAHNFATQAGYAPPIGSISDGDKNKIQDATNKVNFTRHLFDQAQDAWNELNTTPGAGETAGAIGKTAGTVGNILGQLVPGKGGSAAGGIGQSVEDFSKRYQQWRNAKIEMIATLAEHEIGRRYNQHELDTIVSTWFPSIDDFLPGADPRTRTAKFKNMAESFKAIEMKEGGILDQFNLKTPMPYDNAIKAYHGKAIGPEKAPQASETPTKKAETAKKTAEKAAEDYSAFTEVPSD